RRGRGIESTGHQSVFDLYASHCRAMDIVAANHAVGQTVQSEADAAIGCILEGVSLDDGVAATQAVIGSEHGGACQPRWQVPIEGEGYLIGLLASEWWRDLRDDHRGAENCTIGRSLEGNRGAVRRQGASR